MSRFWDRAKRNYRENWPAMLALLAAVVVFGLFGPILGLLASGAALGFARTPAQAVRD